MLEVLSKSIADWDCVCKPLCHEPALLQGGLPIVVLATTKTQPLAQAR